MNALSLQLRGPVYSVFSKADILISCKQWTYYFYKICWCSLDKVMFPLSKYCLVLD